ncbi:hypothetical protein CTEN210_01997 [Chaetoceros tenuissimus]|uniref:RING-type domain-containing protein n=1 Tax=Chaetoceros tenuissimus TaxID=426638 RepID=A0AAD3CH41_9STRA|nr:hypothetical protein CTEN210_01997 [Chaetoceros tenuissimus]
MSSNEQPSSSLIGEGTLIVIFATAGVFLSVVGTYVWSMFLDKFCSTDIDAAVIRMIEELNQGRPEQIPVILKGLTEEERLRVLERVLDCRPYSKELGAMVKLEQEKAEENKKLLAMEQALLKQSDSLEKKDDETVQGEKQKGKDANVDTTEDEKEEKEEENILQRVWKEFGNQGNGNKKEDAKDEVTETCAICMEDYEENEDVIIGDGCVHMYHKDCLLKWMKAKHDFCPYCREYAFPIKDFVSIAKEQVSEERFKELVEQDDEKLVAMYLNNDEENQQIEEESAENSDDSPQDTEEVTQKDESIQKDENSCFP